MSQLFALDAQKAGAKKHVHAETDGSGITVYRDGWPAHARNASEAIRVARDYIGEFLQPAQRGGIPWGLLVTVPEGVASYGEWPLSGRGGDRPDFRKTPLVRIRERWHDSGPLSALENAIEIIKAYSGRSNRVAA
jgi:hypothetical protein